MSKSDLPLFAEATRDQKPEPLSVTELTQRIRSNLEPAFLSLWVRGEVSNLRPAASGHVYFSLKDGGASISAAVFGWGSRRRPFELRDGLEVICHGKISVYPPRGGYQLVADRVEPVGAGALQLEFEVLKRKLAGEGLFAPERKRPLPAFPARIAVITSASGAAIRDVLTVLRRRAPQVVVQVLPVLVQGEAAPAQMVKAIEAANRFQSGDVILLARGGGSMEDLWCFNSERLARAIAASRIPVVSAVGHEIDFTISDFVADVRAPTPSAAAEILTENWVDAVRRLREGKERLWRAFQRDLSVRKDLFRHLAARLISPKDRLREQMQRNDELSLRLTRAMRVRLERGRHAMERLVAQLEALSPLRVLERGFALVSRGDRGEEIVRTASDLREGDELNIRFQDGQVRARVLGPLA